MKYPASLFPAEPVKCARKTVLKYMTTPNNPEKEEKAFGRKLALLHIKANRQTEEL